MSIEFIRKVFGDSTREVSGNASVLCPYCAEKKSEFYTKKKLAIRVSDHLCHCWVCDWRSRNLLPLLRKFYPGFVKDYFNGGFAERQEASFTRTEESHRGKEIVSLPEGFQLCESLREQPNRNQGKKAAHYVSGRNGIESVNDFWYWKFGYVPYDPENPDSKTYYNRVIIPSFDANGEVNYFTGRSLQEGSKKPYLNPNILREDIVFNEINVRWDEELILVEGPFDLVALGTEKNATCCLGSTLGPEFLLFQKIVENQTPVVIAFDFDACKKALVVAKSLSEYGIPVRFMTHLLCDTKDVGSLDFKRIDELLDIAPNFSSNLERRIRLERLVNT